MKENQKSEWRQAAESLAGCIATVNCDCSISESESDWAKIVYNRCQRFMAVIEDKRPDLKW